LDGTTNVIGDLLNADDVPLCIDGTSDKDVLPRCDANNDSSAGDSALAFAVVQVGDGFNVFAAEVGKPSLDRVVGVGLLLGCVQGIEKGFHEGLPSGQDAAEQAGWDMGIVEPFGQADAKSSLRRCSPFSGFRSLKAGYRPRSYERSERGTQ
jgi:hypothetical protein